MYKHHFKYSRKIAEFALNNNLSFAHFIFGSCFKYKFDFLSMLSEMFDGSPIN
jgi:hypothetical protein